MRWDQKIFGGVGVKILITLTTRLEGLWQVIERITIIDEEGSDSVVIDLEPCDFNIAIGEGNKLHFYAYKKATFLIFVYTKLNFQLHLRGPHWFGYKWEMALKISIITGSGYWLAECSISKKEAEK